MQRPIVLLDASMTSSEALARMARHGLWLDPAQAEVQAWVETIAQRLHIDPGLAIQRLARPVAVWGVAVRRQYGMDVFWYGMTAEQLLQTCVDRPPAMPLIDALNLHESDSEVPHSLEDRPFPRPGSGALVVVGSTLAYDDKIAAQRAKDFVPGDRVHGVSTGTLRGPGATEKSDTPSAPQQVSGWPAIEGPDVVAAGTPFELHVGIAAERSAGTAGARIELPVPPAVSSLQLTVELTTAGLETTNGWSQPLQIAVADPTRARAVFKLVALPPDTPQGVALTYVEARFLRDGVVCGTASRPLVVHRGAVAPTPWSAGTSWSGQPQASSPIVVPPADSLPDITIEIAHPEGNETRGVYVCRLSTPHPVVIDTAPYRIDLGDDAKTFARTIVDQMRLYANDHLAANALEALGDLVTGKLPAAVSDALAKIVAHLAGRTPTVLFVSAEQYVPWELAKVTAFDPARPACLGAQFIVGRWVRQRGGADSRPPAMPPQRIDIGAMAVMVGKYKADSGLRALPEAEKEGQELVHRWKALPLPASSAGLFGLLNAKVTNGFDEVGAVDTVHFAGHGEFDPARPDSSMLFLSDGKPLSSLLFRSAKYGLAHTPLAFFNACMIGIGGELLGDAGGFPGNCLHGGFGAVLGALWEVDDALAREIALEFWQRAMPPPGGQGEPVAAIWRDLRARFLSQDGAPPRTTYLSYVFYGHPCLTLATR